MSSSRFSGLDVFEFRDIFSTYVLRRGGWWEGGLEPRRASDLLRRKIQADFFFGQRLASWFRYERMGLGSYDDPRVLDILLQEVESSWVIVIELKEPHTNYAQLERHEPPAISPVRYVRPERPPQPIIDDDRALRILRCDPQLMANEQPLRFEYLMRGLEGKSVQLRILSETFPGKLVHERSLTAEQTRDRVHPDTWDGEVTVAGEFSGKQLPSRFGPCTLELVHDATYRDSASFLLVPPAVVVIGSDVDNPNDDLLCYRHGSAVFGLRGVPRSATAASPTGFIATVLRHAANEPAHVAMIAGHTDTSGGSGANLSLSADRAENLKLFLTDTATAWAEHCAAIAKVDDMQAALAWAAEELGWKCHPGDIDGDLGPKTSTAVEAFRNAYNDVFSASLAGPKKLHVPDWEALRSVYDMAIAELLSISVDELGAARGALHLHELPTLACGERYPQAEVNRNGFRCSDNRRVDVLFFPPGEAPEASHGEEAIAQDVYLGLYRVKRIDVMQATVTTLSVRHKDGRPCPGATVTLALSHGSGTRSIRCDELGRARLYGMSGWRYVVRRVTEAADCFIYDVTAGRTQTD